MIVNIYLMFDESLRDVFSALCKDIQKRLRGRGAELKDEERLLPKFYIILLFVLFCHILLTRKLGASFFHFLCIGRELSLT